MLRIFFAGILLALFSKAFCQNVPPTITNLVVTSDHANSKIQITFDVSDPENDALEISVGLSDDGGETFLADFTNLTGDAGFPVTPGTGKEIEISYDPGITDIGNYIVRVVADDRMVPDFADIVAEVDSVRMISDLTFMASGVRHYQTDSNHLEAVKNFIDSSFAGKGLQTYRQPFTLQNYGAHNIIGRLPGLKDEAKTYIIDAHFDAVDDTPGADDNGSGVAGVLEAMRVLSKYQFEHSIKFIGFDFEESTPVLGLYGSREYCTNGVKPYEELQGVFNYEMIGYYTEEPNTQQIPTGFEDAFPTQYNEVEADSFRGNFVVNTANSQSTVIMNVYDSMAAVYVPDLKVISIALPFNGLVAPDFRRSDHASFWDAGFNALMLTDGANFRNHTYHSPNDTVGAMNFTFMSNIVKATVASILEVANVMHSGYAIRQVDGPVKVHEIGSECSMHIAAGWKGDYLYFSPTCETAAWSTLQLYDAAGRLTTTFSMEPGIKQMRLPNNLVPGVYVGVVHGRQYHAAKRFVVIE